MDDDGPRIDAWIDRWAASGVVTGEQATRMRADAAAAVAAPKEVTGGGPGSARSTSLAVEALGYLGGAIAMVAVMLIGAQLWDELTVVSRLALVGGLAAVLAAAGQAVPVAAAGRAVPAGKGGAGARLRAVLWLAATATVAGFLGIAVEDGLDWDWPVAAVVITCGSAVAAGVLWWRHRHPLQHVATVVAVLAAVYSLLAWWGPGSDAGGGLAVWAVAGGWALLAWGAVLPGARVGVPLGGAGAVVGALTLVDRGWGAVLAVVTVAVLVAAAVLLRDLVLLTVAAVGTLVVLPAVVSEYFTGMLPAALTLLVVGVGLVAAAVVTARRRQEPAVGVRAFAASPGRAWAGAAVLSAVAAVALLLDSVR